MADCEEKFLELKKYIPFLENTIKTLESSNLNPKEPQLTKVKLKALRDLLLLDKNKRMKMDNLIKCEQVLINLRSKVMKANLIPDSKNDIIKSEKEEEPPADLQTVREKLKIVAKVVDSEICPVDGSPLTSSPVLESPNDSVHSLKSHVVPKVTVCSEVRKVPLFERRPKKSSRSKSDSPNRHRSFNSSESVSSSSRTPRKYTRVLCSPEPKSTWPRKISPRKGYEDEVLFHRRSPRRRKSRSRSPRSRSNKKKSHKKDYPAPGSSSSYDVDITLNVPEESLNSLNASDIFHRIVNCDEDDVDIKQLREMRQQILEELKKKSVKHDISDFLLKSCKKKKKKKQATVEVEEGELSDSESESIEKIYRNLTVEVKNDPINVKKEEVMTHLQTSPSILERETRKDSPKIKISLLLSNSNECNANSSLAGKIMASVSKPTTTFLTDIISKESSEEESADKSKREIKKQHIFYDKIKNEENCTQYVTLTSTQDKTIKGMCGQANNTQSNMDSLEFKQLKINVETTNSPSKASELQFVKNKSTETTSENENGNRTKCAASPKGYDGDEVVKHTLTSPKSVCNLSSPTCSSLVSENSQISTLHHIANSIEAVSKPRESFISSNNSNDDKALTDLIYKDLSPRASPNSRLSSAKKSLEEKNSNVNYTCDDISDESSERNKAQKCSQSIPFLSEEKGNEKDRKEISEIDILKALKNEILGEVIKVNDKTETPSLHQPKISKVTDKSQLEADKKKRISIENYKAKTVSVQKVSVGLFAKKAEKKQEDLLRKALTPRECERFQMILPNSLEDELSDDDAQIENLCLPSSELNEVNLGPKSPEEENFTDSSTSSPILIPSDPVKNDCNNLTANTDKKDIDMRLCLPKTSPQSTPKQVFSPGNDCLQTKVKLNESPRNPPKFSCDTNPVNVNYMGRNPKPLLATPINKPSPPQLMTPLRDGSMTPSRLPPMNVSMASTMIQSRNPTMTPSRNSSMTPSRNPSMTPSRNPSMTPSRNPSMTPSRGPLMTPTYSPMFGEDSFNTRGHVYAPSDLPDPSQTPTWDRGCSPREDGSSTPAFKADTTRGGSIMKDVSRASVWDLDIRSPITEHAPDLGYRTPSHEPFTRAAGHNSPFDPYYSSNNDSFSNRNRSGRDPRLCVERKDEPYHRDPRNSGAYHGNKINYNYDFDTSQNVSRNYDMESNRGHDFIHESSVAPESYKHSDTYFDQRFRRERSVGRYLPDEPINNQEYNEESYAYNRDPRGDRNFTRASSVGRNIPRERSESRMVQVVSDTRNMYAEQNLDRNMRGTSMGRELHVGRNMGREPSVGRNMGRESSVGRNMGLQLSCGRNMGSELNAGRNLGRAPSVGRYTGLESNIGRNRGPEPSIVRNMGHEASRGRSIGREPSMGRSTRREASMGRNIDRERLDSFENSRDNCADNRNLETSSVRRNIENSGLKESTQSNIRVLTSNSRDPRSRRDLHDSKSKHLTGQQRQSIEPSRSQRSSNNSSPREGHSKANKDKIDHKKRDDKSIDNTVSSIERNKNSGVVYTSDNIAKGNILEPGYGVKNYKIPKIKRPIEETVKPDLIQQKDTSNIAKYVDSGNNKVKCTEFKDTESVSDSKQVRRGKDKTPKSKQVTRQKDDRNIINKSNKIDSSLVNSIKSKITYASTDSESSSEFDEILTKINQSQVEASSDTDESLQDNPTIATNEKIDNIGSNNDINRQPTSLIVEQHVHDISVNTNSGSVGADSIIPGQETKSCENETQTEGTIKKKHLINDHMSPISIECAALDKSAILDDKVILINYPDTKICSVKLTKSELSPAQIEKIGPKIANICDQSEEIPEPVIKKGDNIELVEKLEKQLPPTDSKSSQFSENKEITSTSLNVARQSKEPPEPERPHSLNEQIMHKNDNNNEEKPELEANDISSINSDQDRRNHKIDEVFNSESSAPVVNSSISVDRNEPTSCDDKDKLNTEQKCSSIGTLAGEEIISRNESEINSSLLSTVPDSTMQHNDVEEITDENVFPDSTNNSENNTNVSSVVSSSHDVSKEERNEKENDSIENDNKCNAAESLSSILSLLQDKSKIVQIMAMITNEKLKKRLSKFSQIESDDEDDTEPGTSSVNQEKKSKSGCEKLKDTDRYIGPTDTINLKEKNPEHVSTTESKVDSQSKVTSILTNVENAVSAENIAIVAPQVEPGVDKIVVPDCIKVVDNATSGSHAQLVVHNVVVPDNENLLDIVTLAPQEKKSVDKVVASENNKVLDATTNIGKVNVPDKVIMPGTVIATEEVYNKAIVNETNEVIEQAITNENISNKEQVAVPQNEAVSESANAREHIGISSDTLENKKLQSDHNYPPEKITTSESAHIPTLLADKDKNEQVVLDNVNDSPQSSKKKKIYVKTKNVRFRNRKIKKGQKKLLKNALLNEKRMTRSESAQKVQVKRKRRNRELQILQEDIRDMFISEDVLNATGIRMCRLAKLSDDTSDPVRSESEERILIKAKGAGRKGKKTVSEHSTKEALNVLSDPKPLVVIEKTSLINTDLCNKIDKDKQEEKIDNPLPEPKIRKKPGPKPKPKVIVPAEHLRKGETKGCKIKPGPKFKNIVPKNGNEEIPNKSSASKSLNVSYDSLEKSLDSDEESLSSLASIAGSERITDSKTKPKKKAMLWKLGIIKSNKKKTTKAKENSQVKSFMDDLNITIPDYNCFTDKAYCFEENTSEYRCRICVFVGENIVLHYKQKHPHCEVPLSRLNFKTAVEAIEQSHTTDFDRFRKKHRTKIICRFCFQVFESPKLNLEKFFWHVVSKHTGEYKYPCFECTDPEKCTTALDIPSPPEPTQALLLGFICGECHYTQISLNNLKTHVALRHDNEETEVYTVNLCDIPPELLGKRSNISIANKKDIVHKSEKQPTRKLRSKREKSLSESSDTSKPSKSLDEIPTTSKQPVDQHLITSPSRKRAKRTRAIITFDSDSSNDSPLVGSASETIKSEIEDTDVAEDGPNVEEPVGESLSRRGSDASEAAIVWENAEFIASLRQKQTIKEELIEHDTEELSASIEYDKSPHFMITTPKVGVKSTRSYVCRITGCRNNYRTTLLISLKKHVQFKHVAWRDFWDGYCCVCEQVVGGGSTRQSGSYSDCLNHMLMKHLDHFPVLQEPVVQEAQPTDNVANPKPSLVKELPEVINKKYINVRPLSDMISNQSEKICKHETINEQISQSSPPISNVVSLESATENVHEQIPHDRPQSVSSVSEAPVSTHECIARHFKTGQRLPCPINATNKVLAEKHPAVRESTLTSEKLAAVYKCAGKYCSFVGRTVASYLEHLHAHLQVKRDNWDVLRCAYCEFNSDAAEPLAEHMLREHGHVRFSCRYCWYAATAALLVELHSAREHPKQTTHVPLLIESQILDEAASTRGMLSRITAVPLYTCSRRGSTPENEACAFRSYTSPKYREHLEQRHKDDAALYCFVCSSTFGRPNSLIAHLKLHGLCLFQCTYCLYGADTEPEMLQHAADYHPARRPQAYLRHILETKDPLKKINKKMLPLMRLDKEVPFTKMSGTVPVTTNDNPTKEVERANALERLVLQHSEPVTSSSPLSCLTEDMETPVAGPQENSVGSMPNESPKAAPQIEVKIEAEFEAAKHNSNKTTDKRNKTSDEYIICLDSDEDEKPSPAILLAASRPKAKGPSESLEHSIHDDVIDLSDDDSSGPIEELPGASAVASLAVNSAPPSVICDPLTTASPLPSDKGPRFGPDQMFKCQKCQEICKNDYCYRSHLLKCYPENNPKPKCPHCEVVVDSRKNIRIHLIETHGPVKSYQCSICNLEDRAQKKITHHMNVEHNVLFTTICLENPGTNLAIMRYSVKPEEGKTMSTTSAKGPRAPPLPPPPAPPKVKPMPKSRVKPGPKSKQVLPKPIPRYGPEDIDRLPLNPILDEFIQCSRCEFGTKVRSNMIRHLQMHASTISVPSAAPVNPVPHLESNEMHFDKMANLAASSNTVKPADRSAAPSSSVPPETAAKYPKYVPEKDRNFCGAVGCSYMSLDETLLKYHWETLHTGLTHGSQATTYRCVHCPPHQQLDTSRPLTASRIIGHLKMHDARLYGCGDCSYYHYQRPMVERHVTEKHGPIARGVILIREPPDSSPVVPTVDPRNAPTMDLKPWQCGVCKFKSMLRPEVAEHCSKIHGFKFQFKCSFCPYSGSVQTSVFRHQVERHLGRMADDIIHVYYKERSLPADEETCPLWTKQRSFLNSSNEIVKAEGGDTGRVATTIEKSPPLLVDLAIVKSEVEEASKKDTLEDVMARFGHFCEPKDHLYLCPLCKAATEESKQAFVSHLHEELNYRKWSCTMCPYKAFSKLRLMEHSFHEHKQTPEPTQLPPDRGVEMWIEKLLEHQERAINVNKAKKASQEATAASLLKSLPPLALKHKDSDTEKQVDIGLTVEAKQELENTFGLFGLPNGDDFVCPKCDFKTAEEDKISQHLEIELARVRWACSQCSIKFQHYHEAQKHCSTVKHSSFAHVSAVSKDPSQRALWIQAVILTQRLVKNRPRASEIVGWSADKSMDTLLDIAVDNSLLVERYAEEIPGPSHQSEASLNQNQPLTRKRKSKNLQEDDSDEVTSEPTTSEGKVLKCPHCTYTTRWKGMIRHHKLRHFNLQSHRCGYCPFMAWRDGIKKHVATAHPGKPFVAPPVKVPEGSPPIVGSLPKATRKRKSEMVKEMKNAEMKGQIKDPMEEIKHVCLLCDEELCIEDAAQHQAAVHAGSTLQLEVKGTLVRKCGVCMVLCPDAVSLQQHHDATHAGQELNYSLFKVGFDKRSFYACGHCNHTSRFLQDLKCHHNTVHATSGLSFKLIKKMYKAQNNTESGIINLDGDSEVNKRPVKRKKDEDAIELHTSVKRVAKKSTTRLPFSKTTARKSTTKLPFHMVGNSFDMSSDEDEDYSYYGTKPTPVGQFGHVRTKMPFYDTMMPTTVKQLSEIVNISPYVLVKDLNKKFAIK